MLACDMSVSLKKLTPNSVYTKIAIQYSIIIDQISQHIHIDNEYRSNVFMIVMRYA